ncbi:MAG: gamma carbonic anhydrase family protein [Planctomycetota bacterium]|jgi:carbonic anhydrase/acetyltransferase-like protein (isoleucine patch superfamily)
MLRKGDAFVASTAVIEADVTLHAGASVWWQAVLRGDDAPIVIGERSNIQDFCMVHADPDVPLIVGREVTVGHHAVLHCETIEDRALIGIGAILLAGAKIGSEAIIAAGAVVPEGMIVPPRVLVAGVPGKVKRDLKPDEIALHTMRSEKYFKTARDRAGL